MVGSGRVGDDLARYLAALDGSALPAVQTASDRAYQELLVGQGAARPDKSLASPFHVALATAPVGTETTALPPFGATRPTPDHSTGGWSWLT